MGAESSTAIRLSADGTVEDAAGNDKCAEKIANKCAVFAQQGLA
jgi:hypothetical protein